MKRVSVVLLFLTIHHIIVAQTGETIILNETFNDNKNNWPVNESRYRTTAVSEGKYTMRDSVNGDMWIGIPVAINESGKYSITASVTHRSGSETASYGIIFGGKDAYNCYHFSISANGNYWVNKIEKSRIVPLISWTKDNHIATGNNTSNTIAIVKQGQTWQFFINNVMVNSCKPGKFFGTITGFEKAHNQWVEFDDLIVKDLNGPAIPIAESNTLKDTIYPCQLIEKLPQFRENNFASITGNAVINNLSTNKYNCKFAVTAASSATISYFSENNFSFDAEFARCKTENEAKLKLEGIKQKFEACNGKAYILRNYIANAYAITINTSDGFNELGIMLAVLPDALNHEYTVNLTTASYDRESHYQYITVNSDSSILAKQLQELVAASVNKFDAISGKKISTDKKTYKTSYECRYQLNGALSNGLYELYNRYFEAILFEKITDTDESEKLYERSFESIKMALGKGFMHNSQTIKNWKSYNFYYNDTLYHNGMISLIKEQEADGNYTIKIQVQSVSH